MKLPGKEGEWEEVAHERSLGVADYSWISVPGTGKSEHYVVYRGVKEEPMPELHIHDVLVDKGDCRRYIVIDLNATTVDLMDISGTRYPHTIIGNGYSELWRRGELIWSRRSA